MKPGLGCRKNNRNSHLQQQFWRNDTQYTTLGDCLDQLLETKDSFNNSQPHVPTAMQRTSSWMTPSRTGCDHEFQASGNTSWRAMTHQVQV